MTNWTPFIYGLGAVYLLYYLANVAFDLFKPRTFVENGDSSLVISVADLEEPVDATIFSPPESMNATQAQEFLSSGEVTSSGGVPFGELLELAASDAIVFTRQIPN